MEGQNELFSKYKGSSVVPITKRPVHVTTSLVGQQRCAKQRLFIENCEL